MKNRILAIFAILLVHTCYAQSCLTSSLIINTGYDPIAGAAITPGVNGGVAVPDPHWMVTYESPDIATAMAITPITGLIEVTPGSSANVVTPIAPPWWVANPIGNPGGWISCLNSNEFWDNTADTATWNQVLTRPFRMCLDDSVILSFYIANDNYISATSIDGIPLSFFQPSSLFSTNASTYTYFSQTVFLTAGTHNISFINNNATYNSTYVAQENPMGLNVYGTVSSATHSSSIVSESSATCLTYVCSATYSCNIVSLPDTLHACPGTRINIIPTITGTDSILSISWSPVTGLSNANILNPTLTVGSTSSWYYITVYQQNCTTKDSIYINVSKHNTTIFVMDTLSCSTIYSLLLNAPDGYTSYLWNTGSTSSSISVSYSYDYWVFASSGCVAQIDTFKVVFHHPPFVYLGNDTSICAGDSIKLTSDQHLGSQFLWNNNSTSNSITINEAGTYWLSVIDSGCKSSDTIVVTIPPGPSISLGPDTTLCIGDVIQLSANSVSGIIKWWNGYTGNNVTIDYQGKYWVTAVNGCGSTTDTININFILCDIWFPSAFTPNGDKLNDIIQVKGNLEKYQDFTLSIYNRWGQQVFSTNNIYTGWDGLFNSTPQELGTYFYMITFTLEGKKGFMKGDFQLIR